MPAETRCIPNDFPEQLTLGGTDKYLQQALEDIIKHYPPLDHYDRHSLEGLWSGPTGIAYLFLHVSSRHPKLIICGHHALTWAKSYLKGSRGSLKPSSRGCGIGDERLCYLAVAAAVTKDEELVRELVSNVKYVVEGEFPDELLYGRAGTLYLLRLVRQWVPDSSTVLDDAVAKVSQKIMRDGPHWKWHGKRYMGAVHGDIGILTQLILTTPGLAPKLEGPLDALLNAQLADGNWPSSEGHTSASLVQFCHGATGFVHSLLSLREYFPRLQQKIDAAVGRGRECIWTSGLLRKEPSLCHGIFGNALALAAGQQREHFLAVATPEQMRQLRKQDKSLFEAADYGKPYSLTTSYAPCAAWSWLVCGEEHPRMIAFNDV